MKLLIYFIEKRMSYEHVTTEALQIQKPPVYPSLSTQRRTPVQAKPDLDFSLIFAAVFAAHSRDPARLHRPLPPVILLRAQLALGFDPDRPDHAGDLGHLFRIHGGPFWRRAEPADVSPHCGHPHPNRSRASEHDRGRPVCRNVSLVLRFGDHLFGLGLAGNFFEQTIGELENRSLEELGDRSRILCLPICCDKCGSQVRGSCNNQCVEGSDSFDKRIPMCLI